MTLSCAVFRGRSDVHEVSRKLQDWPEGLQSGWWLSLDIIASECPDVSIAELESLPFGDAGPGLSISGYFEHIEG